MSVAMFWPLLAGTPAAPPLRTGARGAGWLTDRFPEQAASAVSNESAASNDERVFGNDA